MARTNEQRTIARIVKVNHAGEYGAIRIYRSQLWVARRLYPDVAPFLRDTLNHENRHCRAFREAMSPRRARPCRVMSLWANGGYLLGLGSALFGRRGIWVCTQAVERAVHRHMDEQIAWLSGRDETLRALVEDIRVDERAHLDYANARLPRKGVLARLGDGAITLATECVIWLSTWGASRRMRREIRHAH